MHLEVLTPPARLMYPSLAAFQGDFYLAGGTGLALQIGHRVSVDFDLFSEQPIPRSLLRRVEGLYAGQPQEMVVSTKGELTLLIHGVKITFLHYPFPPIQPLTMGEPMRILGVKEILAGKAYTIGRRGEFKDYVDLFSGLNGGHTTLRGMIALAQQKYGEAFNDRLFLEQLVYLGDVDEARLTMLGSRAPSKTALIHFFSSTIAKEKLP